MIDPLLLERLKKYLLFLLISHKINTMIYFFFNFFFVFDFFIKIISVFYHLFALFVLFSHHLCISVFSVKKNLKNRYNKCINTLSTIKYY